MTKGEIVSKVKSLGWPTGSYVVFGSGPLAAAGIRQAADIDFLVSSDLFEQLKKVGWQELVKDNPADNPLVKDVFEAHANWDFSEYSPTLEHLLATATIIDGVPFASLEEVKKWKTADPRPKDLVDIKLIDQYLATH